MISKHVKGRAKSPSPRALSFYASKPFWQEARAKIVYLEKRGGGGILNNCPFLNGGLPGTWVVPNSDILRGPAAGTAAADSGPRNSGRRTFAYLIVLDY